MLPHTHFFPFVYINLTYFQAILFLLWSCIIQQKEQSVLDLFIIARVCHYDTKDEEQGVKKLWIDDSSFSLYSLLATRANEMSEQIVLFKQNLLSLDLRLCLDMVR